VRIVHKYLIVYEKTKSGYSAYSPDLEGCVATGTTKKQTEKNMYKAVEMHLKGMVEDGLSFPKSDSTSEYILLDEKNLLTA
jgi:predicted RNase H-like HicB family nuclease